MARAAVEAAPAARPGGSIRGVLIVGGPRAGIAAQTPLRASAAYSPGAADQALIEEAYHERVVALAEAFAGRAPGELGL